MVSQAKLADLIDRSRAAVSQATKEGHHCAGYPIAEWAEFTASGRVKGYHVPEAVQAERTQTDAEARPADAKPGNTESVDGEPVNTGPVHTERTNSATSPALGRQRMPRRHNARSGHSLNSRALTERRVSGDGTTGPPPTAPSPRETAAAKPEKEHDDSPHSPAEFSELSREELPQLALLQKGERLKRQEPSTQPQRTARAEPTNPPVAASKPVDAPKQIDASSRTALLPEGQDYFRPVAAGSAAHALATVAQHDTPAARAITTTCAAAAGALLGYHMTDENPGGALIGASVGFLAVMYGMDPPAFNQ